MNFLIIKTNNHARTKKTRTRTCKPLKRNQKPKGKANAGAVKVPNGVRATIYTQATISNRVKTDTFQNERNR